MASLIDKILGPPLRSSEAAKEKLGVVTGVPVLGLDALSSVAYGPEAALAILAPAGVIALRYLPWITAAILALLVVLYISYRQTIAAYPNGGGAYVVAKENLGVRAGLLAAAALLLDYMLNVAVGISAGVAAVSSAFPVLQKHTLSLCLLVLIVLTFVNLRGVRESGMFFSFPVYGYVGCMAITVAIGFFQAWTASGHPHPIAAPPALRRASEAVGAWLLLRAFASGCTAMTGVETVSNGVPLFCKPTVDGARRTLTAIVVILGVLLLSVAYLCPVYHIGAMDQRVPGYQTILSQLVAAVTGRGIFYYIAIASILGILAFSANTSFAGFPRVCYLLAEDSFLPVGFANVGRRLVFSIGISALAIFSGLILIAFDGITDRLIPLFAVGAFSAFTFSQAGMVLHWRKQKRSRRARTSLVINAAGAIVTGIALVIIIIAKFTQGAWITLVIIPGLMVLFERINRRYECIAREVDRPVKLEPSKVRPPVVVIPIDGWNCVTERALRFALQLSEDVTALHVTHAKKEARHLQELWPEMVEKPARAAGLSLPRLEIVSSPYRQIYGPILDFVNKIGEDQSGRLIAVVIPELVEPHWYEHVLHNMHGAGLRALLFLEAKERTVVITIPWHLG